MAKNKKQTQATTETPAQTPAPAAPAASEPVGVTGAGATTTPAPAAAAKKASNFQSSVSLAFEVATPEEIEKVPAATRQTYGLRAQLIEAVKGLPVKGGIVVKEQAFKTLRGRVGSINRNKLVKTGDLVHKFYVREHEGKTYVIRES